MARRFARVETRRRARGFLLGLLADLPRKNCWTIAEHAGDPDPHGMQHLLAWASWDTDGVRDDLVLPLLLPSAGAAANWSASPAGAGPWRSPSRPARAWPGSMSI